MTYTQSLEALRNNVCEANIQLYNSGLIVSTFGNVSEKVEIDGKVLMGIKPSGVDYTTLKAKDIVILDLEGNLLEGSLRPSSDTPTHLFLYRHLPNIYGVSHTHSSYATAWAQAGLDIPIFGTTHADYANKVIPCTEEMSAEAIECDYEWNTGVAIVNCLLAKDMMDCQMVLVKNHGPFTVGSSGINSVENAIILEQISKIAFFTISINKNASEASQTLINKHYHRKHGVNRYYGQN